MPFFPTLKELRSEFGRSSSNTRYHESKLETCKGTRSHAAAKPEGGAGKPAAGPQFRSAALRGLYAQPERKTERSKARSTKTSQGVCGEEEKKRRDDPDPIIKGSIYPQMNGRRRSELEAEYAAMASRRGNTTQNGRPVHRRHATSDIQREAWESGSTLVGTAQQEARPLPRRWATSDIPWESGSTLWSGPAENVQGRPAVRVNMYPPQAQYIKEEPVKSSVKISKIPTQSVASEEPPIRFNVSRSSLPGDEYRQLKRRQEMQRARGVLELHYAGRHNTLTVPIWHGMKQGFTVRNTERRRISKMQFAVRKAVAADLDLLTDDFLSAMHRRADNLYFSEMTDVDGVPIDEHMMYEFIRMFNEAPEKDSVPKAPVPPPHRRTWIDERNKRFVQQAKQARQEAENAEAVDAGLVNKPHVLVSKFSWDSNDSDSEAPKRLKKTKR